MSLKGRGRSAGFRRRRGRDGDSLFSIWREAKAIHPFMKGEEEEDCILKRGRRGKIVALEKERGGGILSKEKELLERNRIISKKKRRKKNPRRHFRGGQKGMKKILLAVKENKEGVIHRTQRRKEHMTFATHSVREKLLMQ